MADPKKYFARRTFKYAGQWLDRGMICVLRGAVNDEKLIRLGYLQALTKDQDVHAHECGKCGQRFVESRNLQGHGSLRHERPRPMTPAEEDAMMEKLQRREEKEAPLYMEKTQASLKVGAGKEGDHANAEG